MAIQLISTDFDGTIFAEFENPPIPVALQRLLGEVQARGVRWVINTGRDLPSLLETLARARLMVQPDALVLVEREIYLREDGEYRPLDGWNDACHRDHAELFQRMAPDLPALRRDLHRHHVGAFYEDAFSPICVLAASLREADDVQARLEAYARDIPRLSVVRNDVYIRFAHDAYDKGTALREFARGLGVGAESTLVAGDHYNDLPMLKPEVARWMVTPSNGIPPVKEVVRNAGGYVADRPAGEGVVMGMEALIQRAGG
jgi:HAD superfamily hydrolase (TIGR01484 family)